MFGADASVLFIEETQKYFEPPWLGSAPYKMYAVAGFPAVWIVICPVLDAASARSILIRVLLPAVSCQ